MQQRHLERQRGYRPGMYLREHQRTTGKLRSVRLQRTDEICVDDLPTMPIRVPKVTERLLPLDKQGRPYLKRADQDRPLLDLCEVVIREYHQVSGEYPAELVLSAFRFLNLDPVSARFGGFYTTDAKMLIPYVYDPTIHFPDYCVMARGMAKDAWLR